MKSSGFQMAPRMNFNAQRVDVADGVSLWTNRLCHNENPRIKCIRGGGDELRGRVRIPHVKCLPPPNEKLTLAETICDGETGKCYIMQI